MPEPIVAPVETVQTEPVETQTPPQEDLITRVAKFKGPESPKETPTGDLAFDYKEIDKITDPTARSFAEKAYKSMQSGFTKKFQEVADLRKSLEQQANQKPVWTADKIQKDLLSDPMFVSEAQRLAQTNPSPSNPNNSGMTDNEWSALNPTEKAKFTMLETKISQLEQQNQQAVVQQQHQALQLKYPNYAPDFVDTTVKDIIRGSRQITLEDVWKATDYESGLKRAYDMGIADASGKVAAKQQSTSFDGGQTSQSNPPIQAEKGESNLGFFQRIARARLLEKSQMPR